MNISYDRSSVELGEHWRYEKKKGQYKSHDAPLPVRTGNL
jgi:hypothetical protein